MKELLHLSLVTLIWGIKLTDTIDRRSISMNKILLINRLNPQDDSNKKRKIFFIIGNMNSSSTEDKLIDLIHKSKLIDDLNDVVYKYNGVELNIEISKIPSFIKLFAEADLSIYSVYEIYNPEL